METVFVIGIAQGLFLMLFLLFKKENRVANSILAFLIFLISFSLFLNYCYSSEFILKIPHWIGLDNANPFLIPPFIYFYAKSLTSKRFTFKSKDAYHLLPFVIYFLYVFFSFFIKDASYKIDFLHDLRNLEIPRDLLISSFLKIIQAIVYLVLTFSLLRKHSSSIRNEFSYTERINLYWLKVITISITVIYSIRLIGIFLSVFISELSPGFVEGGMELVNVLFIYLMVYFGLSQPEIFKKWNRSNDQPVIIQEANVEEKEVETVAKKTKYASSMLTDDQSLEILKDLENYMASTKPYLVNELTLKDVADALGVHSKNLSQVINEQLNLNFFNFINQYRVEEVKAKLLDENFTHYSILGIALESGFSSKSSFNSIFKKFTGCTPTSYKSATSKS
ncbi:MAG: helix-turn-helix domain-containing protein [Saprospiraceae bacterium]|nr:helix-turn-helix domain-containing protein [Saprospiraceae bacterium]